MPSICLQKYHVSYIANRLLEERGNTKTSSVLPLNTISLSNLETKIMGELDSMWKAALNCYDGSVKQGNACHCLLNPELCGNVLPFWGVRQPVRKTLTSPVDLLEELEKG